MKAMLKEEERSRLAPILVDTVEAEAGCQEIAPVTPGVQHSDRSVEVKLQDYERDFGSQPLQPEDVIDMAEVYPSHEIDPEAPINDHVLRLAGAIVEMGLTNRSDMKAALSVALKKLRLQGNVAGYDQNTSGLQAQALNAIAGARHGFKPARLMYKLTRQTKWERWWKTFGHNDNVKNAFLRRLCPGPQVRAHDLSYWIVIRSCWHCYRPVNGMMQLTSHSDIPTDAPPEEMLGDEWKVYEGLPQQRIGDKGKQVIKTDDDLLFTALGYRCGRGGTMFGEWIDYAHASRHSKATRDEDDEEDPDSMKAQVKGLLKAAGAVIAFIAAFCAAVVAIGWI